MDNDFEGRPSTEVIVMSTYVAALSSISHEALASWVAFVCTVLRAVTGVSDWTRLPATRPTAPG